MPYSEEGKKLQELIKAKGFTVYSFAKRCQYSNARMYKLCSGEYDIGSVKVYNAVIFARTLGFATVDDFLDALGIDILKDLI
ncbi:MAG: helix-turn-helix domain-containing protein [Lachnospiraceae bacterium]|nr:helix-turn-helix domain-containing protein [Lachnospiraceae bacterium]